MVWRVHTENLLKEILQNPSTQILKQPIGELYNILRKVAKRAAELNDPKMNTLMIELTLYTIADPESEDYNEAACDKEYMRLETQNKSSLNTEKV